MKILRNKLLVPQPLQTFPACYGAQTLTNVLPTTSHLSLSCARWSQTTFTVTISCLGPCPSSKILRNLKHDISEAGSAFFFRWDATNPVDPSDCVILSHWVPINTTLVYTSTWNRNTSTGCNRKKFRKIKINHKAQNIRPGTNHKLKSYKP